MKNAFYRTLVVLAIIFIAIQAQSFAEEVESKIVNCSFGESLSTDSGKDGRLLIYLTGWMTAEGTDGRKVAHPFGWMTAEGKDGRIIAYPQGWNTKQGADGRIVAVPEANPVPLLLHNPSDVAIVLENHKEEQSNANDLAMYFWLSQEE